MLRNLPKFGKSLRYGIVGNLYGMVIYFFIVVIIVLVRIVRSEYSSNILEVVSAFINGIMLLEVMYFKYAFVTVILLTTIISMWNRWRDNHGLLSLTILSNVVFAFILFPAAFLILGLLSLIFGYLMTISLVPMLVYVGLF